MKNKKQWRHGNSIPQSIRRGLQNDFVSVPELYAIPNDKVDAELAAPGSQEFQPYGRIPFMWAQSLYVIRYDLT